MNRRNFLKALAAASAAGMLNYSNARMQGEEMKHSFRLPMVHCSICNGTNGASLPTSFSDDFTATKAQWIGATWSSSGGYATNAPTFGNELLTNGNFETGDPPANWPGQGSAVRSRVADPRTGSAGSYSGNGQRGTHDNVFYQSTTMPQYSWWHQSGWCRNVDATSVHIASAHHNQTPVVTTTDWTFQSVSFFDYIGTNDLFQCLVLGSGNGRFDDCSMKLFNTPTLFRAIKMAGGGVRASVDLTLPNANLEERGGLVFLLDNPANPQNYLVAYHDRTYFRVSKIIGNSHSSTVYEGSVYGDGKTISIAYQGNNQWIFKYDGSQVGGTITINDAALVNNQYCGLFATDPEVRLGNFFCSTVSIAATNAYLGGSITNASYGWRPVLSHYYDVDFPRYLFTHQNAGVDGTPSWYGLVRLQTDVLNYSPQIVYVDFAVNDAGYDVIGSRNYGFLPAAEALIRRLRTALPGARVFVWIFTWPDGYSYMTDSRRTARDAWIEIANTYDCTLLRFDTELIRIMPTPYADADVETYYSGAGNVHPNATGGLVAAKYARPLESLAGNYSGSLPARIYTESEDYEQTPQITLGKNLTMAGTGWTVSGNDIVSSTAGDTASFTGTYCSFGVEATQASGAPVFSYSIDGGAETQVTLSYAGINRLFNNNFARGPHTVTLKIISGTVKINRLMVI